MRGWGRDEREQSDVSAYSRAKEERIVTLRQTEKPQTVRASVGGCCPACASLPALVGTPDPGVGSACDGAPSAGLHGVVIASDPGVAWMSFAIHGWCLSCGSAREVVGEGGQQGTARSLPVHLHKADKASPVHGHRADRIIAGALTQSG